MSRWLSIVVLALGLSGCGTIGYYGQAIGGHLAIIAAREPVADLIADPSTPQALRERLGVAQAMRDFSVHALALPAGASYRSYVGLDRKHVTWTVVATPELSLAPVRWCFPVVGCLSYRGYFEQVDADAFAQELRERGHDVHVGGVRAYSTLGWFDDPLLSTMLSRDDASLAQVMVHELAQQLIYHPSDTEFNESYAEVVGRAGARRWLAGHGDPGALARYDERLRRQQRFIGIVTRTRDELERLYASDRSDGAMRAAKAEAFEGLRESHRELAREWGGASPYSRWFSTPLNNARLALLQTYHGHVPAFEHLLTSHGGDFAAFHAAVAALAELPVDERRARLAALAGGR